MPKTLVASLIFTLISGQLTYAQESYTYSQPTQLEDAWSTDKLGSQGIDSALIYQLFNQLQAADHQLHSVLIVRNHQLVLEEYFGDHDFHQLHDLRSASKSIRSILLGIALDQGFIDDINDPISKYLDSPVPRKNLDQRKQEITIRHLITMSTGLDCHDWDKKSKGQEDRVYKKKDWLQYILDLPLIHAPGEVSHYCSMGVVLMVEVISQASGMPINEFAHEYLFKPLGMTRVEWGHTSRGEVIASGKRLYMTPRDMAKIGQLILNKGKWEGKQIVSAAWVEESTTPQTNITGVDYGYLWWNIPFSFHGKPLISRTAMGNGGQYIMIFPELDLVAVFTGGAYNSPEDKLPFNIVGDVILPSVEH